MQLRRALLLFAVVLGLAAVAASLAPPPDERRQGEPPRAQPQPQPRTEAANPGITFQAAARRPARRRIAAGERATVTVEVEAPGQVEIPQLGVLQFADRGTPAVFDVLVPRAGRYEVTYSGADTPARRIGVLEVVSPVS